MVRALESESALSRKSFSLLYLACNQVYSSAVTLHGEDGT